MTGTWASQVLDRIREVEAGLNAMAEWAAEAGADVATTNLLLRPYREILETLHERDLPVASEADALAT